MVVLLCETVGPQFERQVESKTTARTLSLILARPELGFAACSITGRAEPFYLTHVEPHRREHPSTE